MESLTALLMQLQAWHWLCLAMFFIALDVLVTGGLLIGASLAALCTWIFKAVFGEASWQLQFLVFSFLAVVFSYSYKRLFKNNAQRPEDSTINNRAAQMVGQELYTSSALKEGPGKLQIGDTYWKVISPQALPEGSRIRISEYQGMELILEALND